MDARRRRRRDGRNGRRNDRNRTRHVQPINPINPTNPINLINPVDDNKKFLNLIEKLPYQITDNEDINGFFNGFHFE
ncbi:hypothetical protein RclHR1_05130011 [Rhizophagus clarus]|uniref:Uncharacterized protein n=1 Tax=Rhizophagus clarus TaxID=94130 RepID=A0A2Z6SEJ6_9GLOM|nr:hypothetical protein RclHR1_05130011 [Rhizophagus clarus]GES81340.1 hypothetical protein RCL_e20398_RclHR1_05130011 [Rhizophagus clarus]